VSAAAAKDRIWPLELVFRRAERRLEIAFADGFTGAVPFRLLRLESPSAEMRGHGGARPPQPFVPEDVAVLEAEPVGRYAVRLIFSDGHRTGIYSWALLRELAERAGGG
jgi:DUF971 family protein